MMTPHEFIATWQAVQLSERAACQEHFCDLCKLLDQETPAHADPVGAWYAFEKGVRTTEDGQGFADVWLKDHFAWEYKRKKRDLKDAYRQLLKYREDLLNPPLLVVSDMDRFEVHTNFTGTAKKVYAFDLNGLAYPENLGILRKLFTDPGALRPGQTAQVLTEKASTKFGTLADGLRNRGIPAHDAAHFLMKLIFCLFAEDIELLPSGLFTRILSQSKNDPQRLAKMLQQLFEAMAQGGGFGADDILYFNGGLFANDHVIDLTAKEIELLQQVAEFDWGSIEPSIFGTLFERTLDPGKRSQIGAHYTSRDDIETLLNPVMLAPLRQEWDAVMAAAEAQRARVVSTRRKSTDKASAKASPAEKRFARIIQDFTDRLSHVTVLDPACGSGNFLYVALHMLLGLEKEVIAYGAKRGLSLLPKVLPTQLAGLEINPYAAELAQVAIWIGYLQWMRDNGFSPPSNPVLEPIETIKEQDAILDLSDPHHPCEPEWPEAEFIVGNPPFLGTKKLRGELGDAYVDQLFAMYRDRIPNFSDLCCYWFEKSRSQISAGKSRRAGLLATQGIRGGLNRQVLKRIKEAGDIFFAESDRDWVLDGATVHVSMVGFDDGTQQDRVLDGDAVTAIHSNLSAMADITQSRRLIANSAIGFIADVKAGAFDVSHECAITWLHSPNPHGLPNSDVVRPWVNGLDIVRRERDMWIVDFPSDMPEDIASRYESPFEWVRLHVWPKRKEVKRKSYRDYWWIHAEPCDEMRRLLKPLQRFCTTLTVSKHRLFTWFTGATLPDHQLVAFARSDDGFFGILHSRVHEVWARSQGTQVRERESGFRYTPTTCFETFPFPEPMDAQLVAIAAAAKELDELRSRWLNPPELVRTEVLEFPGSVGGPWSRYIDDQTVNPSGIGTVKYPRLVAKDAECAADLKKRTLTNLYNQRPTWLKHAHEKLDAAVFAAYGWGSSLTEDDLLSSLLKLNLERSG